jgi:AraC-like DNA-binding protein
MAGQQLLEKNGVSGSIYGARGRVLKDCGCGYRGYRPVRGESARLRVVPSTQVYLDISFGVLPRLNDADAVPVGAVYGMRTGPVALTRFDGWGILVELSPHGAYTLLGVPLWELTDSVIDVVEVLGRKAGQLVGRLAEASGWQERLALLDDALVALAVAGPEPAPQVVWAWQQLCRSSGCISVAQLATEVGWTRRHLLTRFREQIGLTPKTAARVIRFRHALRLLRQPGNCPTLAGVAQAAGYSDQAHLCREFRVLAGVAPNARGADWSPQFPFVQDSWLDGRI